MLIIGALFLMPKSRCNMIEFKKIGIQCPKCKRLVGHYDGRSSIDVVCKCKNCNKQVIYRVATGEVELKPVPQRASNSGLTF